VDRNIIFILLLISLLFRHHCQAQTPIQISDPKLELKGNIIHISYNILNSKTSEKYSVSIEITDSAGNKINAKAFAGDIGDYVSGGNTKHVTWNLEADSIFMDAEIFIKIYAKAVHLPEPVITEKEEDTAEIVPISFNRTGIIFQSLAFPGLGLSRMTGKPHWIRGAAGYGCIAGSIYFNRKAVSTYEDYKNQITVEDAQNLYDASANQDAISEALAYTAIAIWVADFIWTMVGTSELKKKSSTSDTSGFSFGSSFEPLSNRPLIAIRYSF
jgi:hypothetical protein